MSVEISPPFPVFPDVDGEPLEDGYIYVGAVNQNPQAVPIPVFWDIALTIPAAQPIRTLGGYPSRNGTPSRMYIAAAEYSISVSNKNQTLIYSDLNNLAGTTSLRNDLSDDTTAANGAGLVGFSSSLVYPQGTVGARLNKYITVTDAPFNAVADSVTDNTTAVLAAAVAAGPRGAIYIPPLVKYDFNALMNDVTMPIEVVVYDDSLVNGGYLRDKMTGIFEKGDATAASDTTFVISSGHNAGIFLDNTGKAGGGGGPTRNVGITWTAGRYAVGGIPGAARPVARWEWNGSGDRWSNTLRKRAPFAAVTTNYFRWEAASPVSVAIGDYCFRQNRFYVAATAGTTGSTPPTHTSGTVSDGGVDWTFYQFSYDQGVYSINDYGRIAINAALGTFFRRERMSIDDPGDMLYSFEPVGDSKIVRFGFLPTDASGVAVGGIQLDWTPETLTFTEPVTGRIAGAFNRNGFNQRSLLRVTSTATASDTTPTVAAIGSLLFNNGVATSVTTLDDGATSQEVELVFQTNLTTLVHSAAFQMTGAVNVVPPAGGIVVMRKLPYSPFNWREKSRNF